MPLHETLFVAPRTSFLEYVSSTKKGKQKSSLMNSIPSANSICKFQTSATFDSTDMPVAFGVSYFGRRRNQRQFKYIGYSIIRIPGDNDIDGSIHKFEHV